MKKNIQRDFILGDNWIYYKIYTGEKTSDSILEEIIYPITNELLNSKIIDKWFFIRYQDPDYHLRLRIYVKDRSNIGLIITNFQPIFSECLTEGLIWSVKTDTYVREIERYGENTIEIAESIFFIESKIIIEFLRDNKNLDRDEYRWLFGFKIIDKILDLFSLDIYQKNVLINKVKNSFDKEFGMNKFLKKNIDEKFRINKNKIDNFMESNNIDGFEKLIIIYIDNIFPYINEILKIQRSNLLEVEIESLILSFIHMSMNRLFKSKNRQSEMVIYNYLSRYYKILLGKKHFLNN